MITDEQILVELARRVHGWTCIEPIGWFVDEDGGIHKYPSEWDPFSSWDDAMGLAGKFRDTHGWKLAVGNNATDDGSWQAVAISPRGIADWQQVRDKSGPRAVCMAIAKAAGIEVTR